MEWVDDGGSQPAAWSYVPVQSYSCFLHVLYKTLAALHLERTHIKSLLIKKVGKYEILISYDPMKLPIFGQAML